VAGSGQRELCEVALGLRATTQGSVTVGTKTLHGSTVRQAQAAGAVSIPEDPVADAVIGGLSVLEHMILDGRRLPAKGLGIDWALASERTTESDQRLGLRIAAPHRRLAELSGGNIQRVLLTRELGRESKLVVAAYPSRGLDIANARRTQEILLERRMEGAGVLVISEDLDELMSMADRIVVMHDGHISGEVTAQDFDRQTIGQLMLGGAA
jgi:simple sugar transport system ATP-binding protein